MALPATPSFPVPRWRHRSVPRNVTNELASGPQPVTPWVAGKRRLLAGHSPLGMCASFGWEALVVPAGHRTALLFSFCTLQTPSQSSSKLCPEQGAEWKTREVTVGFLCTRTNMEVFLFAWGARGDWNMVPEEAVPSSLSEWEDNHRHHFLKEVYNFVTGLI